MLADLLTAFALLLIIEGLLPGLVPKVWQQFIRELAQARPGTIRIFGIISMITGAILLQFAR